MKAALKSQINLLNTSRGKGHTGAWAVSSVTWETVSKKKRKRISKLGEKWVKNGGW